MTGEKVNFDASKAKTEARTNERSEIVFPYLDLEAAVDVAKRLYARSGISACGWDELAAEMNQTTSSGKFRLKTATARIFGLVDKDGQGAVKLTDLGCFLVSPGGEEDAKAAAFLHVPLYQEIFEKYRGRLLPPTKALEREMQTLGVASKQTDKARHAFQRSARQAGFFNSGDDRLVRPRSTASSGQSPSPETIEQAVADKPPSERDRRSFRSGGSGGGYHPFIEGLLETLPESGTLWTIEGRAAWLEAAASAFKLIYQGDGQITITAKGDQGKASH